MKMYQKMLSLVLSILGIAKLPTGEDGKVNLSDEQRDLLNQASGREDFAATFEQQANAFMDEQKKKKDQVTEATEQLKALLEESGIDPPENSEEDADLDGGAAPNETGKSPVNLLSAINGLRDLLAKKDATIKKLSDSPEEDVAEEINGKIEKAVKHSKTHLFGSNKDYDAFEGRPWNKRAAGLTASATNWKTVDIDKINEDFGAYWRENRDEVVSLLRGKSRLPEHWRTISNIDDEVTYAMLLTGDVTQARKNKWLPKNKQKFLPQKAKVYPAQIDVEFKGYELQKIETSWVNRMNQSGSQPYKESFVRYLMFELLKKAREEDEISLIKGVYKPTDDESDAPGHYLNKCDGFLKHIEKKRDIEKAYKPYDIGKPTTANIVDYVDELVEKIPAYYRDLPGLYLYMSASWYRKYYEKRKQLEGLMPTYQPGEMTLEKFPNVRLYPMELLDGQDLMFVTTEDNISPLENVPGESELISMDRLKRDIYAYADYKLGIHVHVLGTGPDSNGNVSDEYQLFWSNNVPILTEYFLQGDADDTTPSFEYHHSIQTGVNTQATAITNLDNVEVGQVVRIKGNSGAHPSTIANGGNFVLTGNITLSEGTVITLIKTVNEFVEMERVTNANESDVWQTVEYSDLDSDANYLGLDFSTVDSNYVQIANVPGTPKLFGPLKGGVQGEYYFVRQLSGDSSFFISPSNDGVPSAGYLAPFGVDSVDGDPVSGYEYFKFYFNGTDFVLVEYPSA